MHTARWYLAALLSASVVVFGLTTTASAQEVEVRPLLKSGDEFRLEITRARTDSSQPSRNSRVTTPVNVRVMRAAGDEAVLEWAPGKGHVEAGQTALHPLVQAAAEALDGLRFTVALDGSGRFAALRNRTEVANRLKQAVDGLVAGVMAAIPAEQRPQVQTVLAQVLSADLLVDSATLDVVLFFSLSGISLAAGESASTTVTQPNPLGGDPISATWHVTLQSAAADAAVWTTTTAYDPAALISSVRALAAQAGAGGIPEAEAAALRQLEVSEDARFVLDRASGLMREVTTTRRVAIGGQERVDRTEIRLVQAPRRQ